MTNHATPVQVVELRGDSGGKRFDGIGIVNGGGGTSVLLKDYPEPQRSQILDLVFKPKFGASVSTLLVEIPGDGNSTQGSMPSHMRTRNDLDYTRGYTWWILREAKKRNPQLSLDAAAWSAPGWVGNPDFWTQDSADYLVKWLRGLREVYGLELDAIGCRNEKGVSLEFAKMLRAGLDANGFKPVRLHAFDDWPSNKFDFVKDMINDKAAHEAIDIIGAHTLNSKRKGQLPASSEVQALAAEMGKPIWNTEEHVYLPGFECALRIVQAFNDNYITSGATKIVNWYDIAGVYLMEPYSEEPAMVLAHSPWSGHYVVREALWGYAHYGQFTEVGWEYIHDGCGELAGGGSFVTLKSQANDYSIIIETSDAKTPQQVRFEVGGGLSAGELCVWRSDAREQFIQQDSIQPTNGVFTLTLNPDSIYSLSTTTGQQKGSFAGIPDAQPFPFPYRDDFESYTEPKQYGQLPRYFADIEEVFELTDRPDRNGRALRQVIPTAPNSWAPLWHPYTIIGDEQWQDYEISAEVYLNPGDTAAVMGRVNHVGTGYGTIPQGYFLQLSHDGRCELVVVRGKLDKKQSVGDAEQQATIKALDDASEGGEKILAKTQIPDIRPGQWHTLTLRFEGTTFTGLVDGKEHLKVNHNLYTHGMAGLMARFKDGPKLSMPYYDNVVIKPVGSDMPAVTTAVGGQSPMYNN